MKTNKRKKAADDRITDREGGTGMRSSMDDRLEHVISKLFETNCISHHIFLMVYFPHPSQCCRDLTLRNNYIISLLILLCSTLYYKEFRCFIQEQIISEALCPLVYFSDAFCETWAESGGIVVSRWIGSQLELERFSSSSFPSIHRFIPDVKTLSSLSTFVSPAATGLCYHRWVTIVTVFDITCSSGLIAAV